MRCSSVRRNWYARPKPLPSSRPTYPLSIRAFKRVEGGAIPQPLVDPAVHQLQQLDGELHVPQPTLAQLDLAPGVAGRDVRDHPLAHRLGVGDEVLPLGRPPHHRRHHVHEVLAELRSPALGRDLSMAWNSQVLAQRS